MKKPLKIPDQTGVYIFSKKGTPLYVGRALSFKKRIPSYFSGQIDPRIAEMVALADKLEFKKTDSILDSVILEANLIKEYWPKYNIRDRDDRSFAYIIIDKSEFPRPLIVRGSDLKKLSHANAFGPYQSQRIAKNILRIIRRIFPYSTCLPAAEAGLPVRQAGGFSQRPCFNYQLGLCPGVCTGEISKADYIKNIKNLTLFLKGEKKRLVKKLSQEDPQKARSLSHIQDVVLITQGDDRIGTKEIERIEGYDISHLSGDYSYGAMVVFAGGRPDKKEYRLFKVEKAPDDLRSLEEVLIRRFRHREWPRPNLIMIDGGKPQIDFVSNALEKENISVAMVGISKYGGDKFVYPKNTKKNIKALVELNRGVLLKVREEAHRFSLKSNRRKRKI